MIMATSFSILLIILGLGQLKQTDSYVPGSIGSGYVPRNAPLAAPSGRAGWTFLGCVLGLLPSWLCPSPPSRPPPPRPRPPPPVVPPMEPPMSSGPWCTPIGGIECCYAVEDGKGTCESGDLGQITLECCPLKDMDNIYCCGSNCNILCGKGGGRRMTPFLMGPALGGYPWPGSGQTCCLCMGRTRCCRKRICAKKRQHLLSPFLHG